MLDETVKYSQALRPPGGYAFERVMDADIRRRMDDLEVPEIFANAIAQGSEAEARRLMDFLFEVCLLAACLQADDVQLSRETLAALFRISTWGNTSAHTAEAILMDNDCIRREGVYDFV